MKMKTEKSPTIEQSILMLEFDEEDENSQTDEPCKIDFIPVIPLEESDEREVKEKVPMMDTPMDEMVKKIVLIESAQLETEVQKQVLKSQLETEKMAIDGLNERTLIQPVEKRKEKEKHEEVMQKMEGLLSELEQFKRNLDHSSAELSKHFEQALIKCEEQEQIRLKKILTLERKRKNLAGIGRVSLFDFSLSLPLPHCSFIQLIHTHTHTQILFSSSPSSHQTEYYLMAGCIPCASGNDVLQGRFRDLVLPPNLQFNHPEQNKH